MLFFENTHCERCGHALGFDWQKMDLLTLEPVDENAEVVGHLWHSITRPTQPYVYCANAAYHTCNWLIPAGSSDTYCLACQLNRTIPDLNIQQNVATWQRLEIAKHRLVYTLLRLNLPVISKTKETESGLLFDFLADEPAADGSRAKVITGHDDGVITLNINEADDAERERMRQSMNEPYRTLLGHFRHEVGHYYWMLLARDKTWRAAFRQHFGDERQDYGAALEEHYNNGAPANWQEHYVSAYASAHPWEDWAESWAHYCHIVDTLETAYAFDMTIEPRVARDETLAATVDFDPYRKANFDEIFATWLPLTFAMNSLNRSMGVPDLYPFVNSPPAQAKLNFVHETIRKGV
jgi:hypothetical protein